MTFEFSENTVKCYPQYFLENRLKEPTTSHSQPNMSSSSIDLSHATSVVVKALDNNENVQLTFTVPMSLIRNAAITVAAAPFDDAPGTGKVLKTKSKKDKLAGLSDEQLAVLAARTARRQESMRKSRESRMAPEDAATEEVCQRIPRSGALAGVRCGSRKSATEALCSQCWIKMKNLKNSPCSGMESNSVEYLTEELADRLFSESPVTKRKDSVAETGASGVSSEEIMADA